MSVGLIVLDLFDCELLLLSSSFSESESESLNLFTRTRSNISLWKQFQTWRRCVFLLGKTHNTVLHWLHLHTHFVSRSSSSFSRSLSLLSISLYWSIIPSKSTCACLWFSSFSSCRFSKTSISILESFVRFSNTWQTIGKPIDTLRPIWILLSNTTGADNYKLTFIGLFSSSSSLSCWILFSSSSISFSAWKFRVAPCSIA